jgi:hypothetical protein
MILTQSESVGRLSAEQQIYSLSISEKQKKTKIKLIKMTKLERIYSRKKERKKENNNNHKRNILVAYLLSTSE